MTASEGVCAPSISVIVPVFEEARDINRFLEEFFKVPGTQECEIIVVDGHPGRTTLSAVQPRWLTRIVLLRAPKGRAIQMNAGAIRARSSILLFLHADTRLPADCFDWIEAALSEARSVGMWRGLATSRRRFRPYRDELNPGYATLETDSPR